MPIEIMFAITAAIFTVVGWWFGVQSSTELAVADTIDLLIEKGYIKTRVKQDGEIEILKHDEK